MPQQISRNRIPRVKIGNRPINFATEGAPVSAVSTNVGAPYGYFDRCGRMNNQTPAGGTLVVGPYPVDLRVQLMMWGAGGGAPQGNGNLGGGGAGATMNTFFLKAGVSFTVNMGLGPTGAINANGGDSTCTLPDGRVVTAQGGRAAVNGGLGGTGIGGDLNRTGGRGGDPQINSPWGSGLPGENGGIGGAGSGTQAGASGGGGAAGFKDLGEYPAGDGVFYVGQPSQVGVGGGKGTGNSNGAPNGGALIILSRVT